MLYPVSSDLGLERLFSPGWCLFMRSGYFTDSYILGADLTNQNSCSAKAELDAVDKLGVNALKLEIWSRLKEKGNSPPLVCCFCG